MSTQECQHSNLVWTSELECFCKDCGEEFHDEEEELDD